MPFSTIVFEFGDADEQKKYILYGDQYEHKMMNALFASLASNFTIRDDENDTI